MIHEVLYRVNKGGAKIGWMILNPFSFMTFICLMGFSSYSTLINLNSAFIPFNITFIILLLYKHFCHYHKLKRAY